jgi:surfeit locus 1 family protein
VDRYAFLKSPLWIAGIAIVVAIIIAFVNIGLWQLRRLDERRGINAIITARSDADPMLLRVALATYGPDPEALVYRRVLVDGAYDAAAEVMVVGKTLNGRSGHDVVTPFTGDSATIAVNRGWVPIDTGGPPAVGAAPPPGPVQIVGVLAASQTRGSLGTAGADGTYEQVGRIDLEALSGQWGGDLLPVYLLLEEQTPAGGELPVTRPPPQPSEGSHLVYAFQWFVFAIIGAVGFSALVMQNAKRSGSVHSER